MSLFFKKSAALIFSSENLLPTGIKLLDAILFSAQRAAAGDKLRTDAAGASPDGIAPGATPTSREGAPPGPCDQQAAAILTRDDLALIAGPQSLARIRKMANLLAKTNIVVDGVSAPALAWQETTKRGDVLYRLSPHIVPHIVPRIYGRLSARYLRAARSGHALRLYEIAALYAGRKNPTWEVDIDRLIEIFGLPEAYRNRPDNLKARVVEAAIDEINAASPLLVAYEMLPAGAKHARPLFRFFAGHKTANANPVAANLIAANLLGAPPVGAAAGADAAQSPGRRNASYLAAPVADAAKAILRRRQWFGTPDSHFVSWNIWLSSLPPSIRRRHRDSFLPWLSLTLAATARAAANQDKNGARAARSRRQLRAKTLRRPLVGRPNEDVIQLVALALGREEVEISSWADQWQDAMARGRDAIVATAARLGPDESFLGWATNKATIMNSMLPMNLVNLKKDDRIKLVNQIEVAQKARADRNIWRAALAGAFLEAALKNGRQIAAALKRESGEGGRPRREDEDEDESLMGGRPKLVAAGNNEAHERETESGEGTWLQVAERLFGAEIFATAPEVVAETAGRLAKAEIERQNRILRGKIAAELRGGRLALLPSVVSFAAARNIRSAALLSAEVAFLAGPAKELSDMPGYLTFRAAFLIFLSQRENTQCGEVEIFLDEEARRDMFCAYAGSAGGMAPKRRLEFSAWAEETARSGVYPIDCEIDFALWRQRRLVLDR